MMPPLLAGQFRRSASELLALRKEIKGQAAVDVCEPRTVNPNPIQTSKLAGTFTTIASLTTCFAAQGTNAAEADCNFVIPTPQHTEAKKTVEAVDEHEPGATQCCHVVFSGHC